jgi:hypothetical protein
MLEKLDKMDIKLEYKDSDYKYNGAIVPRVTQILSSFNDDDRLMYWSNSLGFRRIKYKDALNKAAGIGTSIHNGIEHFLEYNSTEEIILDYSETYYGVQSFIEWYNDVSKNNIIEIIDMEQKLVCPWFGGTYDCLAKINGKTYLIDFKSSNHVGYKYFLQLAAYRYMLKTTRNIDLDGVIILQVDKKEVEYEEYVLDFSIKEHNDFILQCTESFFALVYTYYNMGYTQFLFNKLF